MRKYACLLVLMALGLTGCAIQSSQEYASYREEVDSWGYADYVLVTLKDLGADFVDMFSIEFSYGPGLIIDIQPTKLLQHGFGFAQVGRIGFRGRAAGFYHEVRKEGGISGLYYRSLDFTPVYGTMSLFERPRTLRDFTLRHETDRNWADIGVSLHFVFLGGGFYISPMNMVDFFADVVCLPYNIALRPIFRVGMNLNPPEIDLGNDDTLAQVAKKFNLEKAKPLKGFPPAETADSLFRVGY